MKMKTKYGFYDVFVKTSAKYPGNIAARVYNDETKEVKCYTYSEMFGVSEYIGQQLRQLHCSKGLIGLVSSINLLVPCVAAAAHKCCTSFIFLDPNEKNEKAIQELDITCLITITKDDDTFEPTFKKPDIVTKVFGMEISFYNTSPFSPFITSLSDDEHEIDTHSFVAMTSGSTGDPKRIEVPVRCILPNICDLTTFFNITPTDVIYFSTPLTFDPSMVEILLAWMNGASLLIAPGSIEALFPKDSPHAVTVWQTTPSKFFLYSNVNIKNHILGEKSPLKILALGGEPLHGVKRLKELKHPYNKTKLFTLYGVTEMSCWACIAELNLSKIDHDYEVPLGNCLSETQINIELDDPPDNQNKTMGKILLSSKTRKCCVLNRVENKVNGVKRRPIKFVDTGDIGEMKEHGIIYYRGRRDDVIKRFGYKIQLSLIESTCMLCPRIKACACIWLPTPKLLVVYFTAESCDSQNLSDFLRCKLDERYWPDKIIRINSMPLNCHGKVSKSELYKLIDNRSEVPVHNNMNNLKLKFLQQLKTVLSLQTTYDGIKNKTFFDIGGSSFLAITLCNNLSVNDSEFAEFLLPHLLSPKNKIDEIMKMAELKVNSNITAKENIIKEPKKRSNKCEDEVSSCSNSISNVSCKKSKIESIRSSEELVEFIEMWTYDSGKCVDASPSLIHAGVNLYVTVGSHSGVVVVADGLTGTIVGEIQLNSRVEAAVSCYQGSSDFPPFGVVGTYDGTVLCFAIETCTEKWRTNIGSMVKSKAVCWEQIVHIASYDGCIRQLNLLTGKVLKTQKLAEQPISADLVLAKDEYIMIGSLSGLCGAYHIETGSLVWRNNLSTPIFAAPVLYAEDKYAIFAQVNGEMHCMTVEKGITIWKYSSERGHIFSSILVRERGPQSYQLVFGCYDKHIYSVMVNNFRPSLDWSADLEAPIYATPCMFTDKLLLAASNDGKLHVVTLDQGAIIAQYSLPKETFSSPAAYGDYIFIGCRNDLLYSLRCVVNS